MSFHSQGIAIIGLGRFGMALARRLMTHGAEVIAIDCDTTRFESADVRLLAGHDDAQAKLSQL